MEAPRTAPTCTVYEGINYPNVTFYDAQSAQVLHIPKPSKLTTQDLPKHNGVTYGISRVIVNLDLFNGNRLRVVIRPLVLRML